MPLHRQEKKRRLEQEQNAEKERKKGKKRKRAGASGLVDTAEVEPANLPLGPHLPAGVQLELLANMMAAVAEE